MHIYEIEMWLFKKSAMQETLVGSLGWEDSSGGKNGNPFQYSCLGNPTKESGRLQSMGLKRVGHDLATKQ